MTDVFAQLQGVLADQGRVLKAGDGELLVSTKGARVLACRMSGVEGNAFYHDPKVEQSSDKIVGGDRLWIAPEVAYYWLSLEHARQDPVKWATTPEAVDPGDYELVGASDARVHLANEVELTDVRAKKTISFLIDREVHVAERPAGLPGGVRCASFTITNTLSLHDGDDGAVAGAWDILQVPPTGTLVCPTVRPVSVSDVTSYYDPYGPKHVAVDAGRVRFLIDLQRRIKMGLRAEDTNGRMAYYRPLGNGQACAIVRIFAPLPGEPYVDVPRSADPSTRTGGDCLQAYGDDLTFGRFGEMEYHDPAIIVGHGPTTRSGTCVTHVLGGDDAAVRAAGERLIGCPIDMIA